MPDNKETLPVPINYQLDSLFSPIIEQFSGSVSLYDEVMNSLDQEIFDNLTQKDKLSVAGMSFFDGGIFEEKLTIAGRVSSRDDVITKKLSVAGKSVFKGLLAVADKASIAGSCSISEDALFGGKVSIAGSATIEKNLVSSGGIKVAGRVTVKQHLLADSPVTISGKLNSKSIRTNDVLKIEGRVLVQEDLVAKKISMKSAAGLVEGNVYAEQVEYYEQERQVETTNLTTIGGLFSYLKNTIVGALTGRNRRGFIIQGNVIADDIEVDNVIVYGDIIGKRVKLGDNVQLTGSVYYLESLECSDPELITSHQGLPSSLTDDVIDSDK